LIPPLKDIQRCKDYLNKALEYQSIISELEKDKEFNTNGSSLYDGMPRGSGISNKTMHEALDNVDIDRKIRYIEKKLNKVQKNIIKVLDKYDTNEKLMRDIIEGTYILNKPKSQIAREIGASRDGFPVLISQAYKTYTYYFYRSRITKRRT